MHEAWNIEAFEWLNRGSRHQPVLLHLIDKLLT